ncbi:DNA mismatch repair endonuclease MutL [Geobacter sp. DSM 9736]|uniref:DNA mismatch repair endonuclease MutL n=1 Tax=Geobacter sp. DSM 9736 TaxID=1277350 RepID=UPI000B507199|nr:DNA mismatch repair endonuclease MutL [Geobacter sp. DSM 9736]SNB45265.1 DNA mismatch repair protein MutL [Geobacter sp. DSM 9736]
MATRIKIIPEQLANKIAAGEVVERPASVIKELVENSLDSGCSEIIVEIEGGGKKLIRVTDDGSGMSREDALLALERHATSKISSDADLFSLTTLGFRGEALPSIASVSRLTLATCERAKIEGTEIYAEGGKIREVKACGMAAGTVISVRNLFFNTPARLKFMKSVDTEAGHVAELLTRLALSRPEIRFTYLNDGRTVFAVGKSELRHRATTLLGRQLASALYPVEHQGSAGSVRGLIASPGSSRSSSSGIYTYINGRYIRDRVVQHAILQGYRNCLEKGRYPVVVLFIDVPAEEVDVNVHPTKHEVRFREQARVHDLILNAVETVLRDTPWVPRDATRSPFPLPLMKSTQAAEARVAEVRESLAVYQPSLQAPLPPAVPVQRQQSVMPSCSGTEALPSQLDSKAFFRGLTIIGQFNAAYILCQRDTDLIIIDQHAAHERVAFESLKRQFASNAVEGQGLLFPHTVELSPGEASAIGEHAADLAQIGYDVEHFGGATWIVKSVPRLLADRDYLRSLRDILEELQSFGKSRAFSEVVEDILARIACHSVVRGSHPLSEAQIRALLGQMDDTDFSATCPHGRPVFRTLALSELERMFNRT